MKKSLILAVLLIITGIITAQEHKKLGWELPDSIRSPHFELPDSLAHLTPWKPDYRTMAPMKIRPAVSMSSVSVVEQKQLPTHVIVLNNNTLRLGRSLNISNGQAWNYSPFPNGHLDARTLSMPMRR